LKSEITNINKIASAVRTDDNNKSNKRIGSNGSDILADLANYSNNDYIIAQSPTVPNKKYYLPRKRSRKVSKGKNPVQDNNIQQSITTDSMKICANDASQCSFSSDLQSDFQNEESTINNPDENLHGKPKRDRPRTLPDFMSKKRSKYIKSFPL
jgi:hypothetical protein